MKRGIVIPGAQFDAEPGRLQMTYCGVKDSDLRFSLFYFDLIERPTNNIMHIAPSHDEVFLCDCKILTNTNIIYQQVNDIGALMFDCHSRAFKEKTKNKGEHWSSGFSGTNWIQAEKPDANFNLIEMSLYDSLPCPSDDVPLADILEFKMRRQDELEALRARLDEIYEQIAIASDVPRAMSAALTRLSQAINELNVVVDESFTSRLISGFKVQIDPMAIGGFASAGALTAAGFGIPIELGLIAGAAVSTIKFEYSSATFNAKMPEHLKDFAYLYQIDSGLKIRK